MSWDLLNLVWPLALRALTIPCANKFSMGHCHVDLLKSPKCTVYLNIRKLWKINTIPYIRYILHVHCTILRFSFCDASRDLIKNNSMRKNQASSYFFLEIQIFSTRVLAFACWNLTNLGQILLPEPSQNGPFTGKVAGIDPCIELLL